jgi:hypothetical protein
MDFEFNLPVSAGILVVIVAAGTSGLISADIMSDDTIFQMVLPSMVLFAIVAFLIGMKHGEYRGTRR